MRRDPNIFMIGEDIARFGGPMKVTGELLDEFGEKRVGVLAKRRRRRLPARA